MVIIFNKLVNDELVSLFNARQKALDSFDMERLSLLKYCEDNDIEIEDYLEINFLQSTDNKEGYIHYNWNDGNDEYDVWLFFNKRLSMDDLDKYVLFE